LATRKALQAAGQVPMPCHHATPHPALELPRMNAFDTKQRLLTRSDMDGLVCAVRLEKLDLRGEIVFHHHASAGLRNRGRPTPNCILEPDAESAAQVVSDHYGGKARVPRISDAMRDAVDKADCAGFSRGDLLHRRGWELRSC
jgi:hypothetical protein